MELRKTRLIYIGPVLSPEVTIQKVLGHPRAQNCATRAVQLHEGTILSPRVAQHFLSL